jgi:hypothetical protein
LQVVSVSLDAVVEQSIRGRRVEADLGGGNSSLSSDLPKCVAGVSGIQVVTVQVHDLYVAEVFIFDVRRLHTSGITWIEHQRGVTTGCRDRNRARGDPSPNCQDFDPGPSQLCGQPGAGGVFACVTQETASHAQFGASGRDVCGTSTTEVRDSTIDVTASVRQRRCWRRHHVLDQLPEGEYDATA